MLGVFRPFGLRLFAPVFVPDGPFAPTYYLRPDSASYYRRPGGVDRYVRP